MASVFGRLQAEDVRDASFPMRALLPVAAPVPRSRYWWSGGVVDQGNEGICVAAAWRQWMSGSPTRTRGGPTMRELYDRFILNDEWPENDSDNSYPRDFGTSVRAGAKTLSADGRIVEYRWAVNAQDAIEWIQQFGPVVIGVNWYTGMCDTDSSEYVHTTGIVEGGHAVIISGYSLKRDAVRGRNSWGRSFGYNGWFWLKRGDLDRLITENGEACAAVEKAV